MAIVIKQWNRYLADNLYNKWIENNYIDFEGKPISEIDNLCDDEYLEIQQYLESKYEEIIKIPRISEYKQDILFGLELYKLFPPEGKDSFFMAFAEDNYFWAYINMRVIPNIVRKRWIDSKNLDEKMYLDPKRNWTMQIWWFIYLSFYENLESTREMLLKPNFNRDTIVQLCDRTGEKGIVIDLYRKIIKKYSEYEQTDMKEMDITFEDFFRKIMKLQTSRIPLYEPMFYDGGIDGYVNNLFEIVENSQKGK